MSARELNRGQKDVVQRQVGRMFARSRAFATLPRPQREQIERDTRAIVEAMAARGGRQGDPYALPLAEGSTRSRGADTFQAEGVMAGVHAAGQLVREVNFPDFVAQLVQGTFHSIVQSSIEQMRAYAELVQSVSKSLNEFRDQNVSVNQGRDHLVSRYPNLFQINVQDGEPMVGTKPGAEFADLPNFKTDLGLDEDVTDLDQETIEQKLVPAARTDLATNRQKLLATMVLMGINRIIVTDGKINAKVRFTFQAQDAMTRQTTAVDYENYGTAVASQSTSEYERGESERSYDDQGRLLKSTDGNRYSTGAYQYTSTPVVKVTSQTDTQTQASLVAQGQLSGEVSLNFRSETFPLERMVDTNQMFQLENAQRGVGHGAPGAAAPAAPAPATATAPAPAPAPATAPA